MPRELLEPQVQLGMMARQVPQGSEARLVQQVHLEARPGHRVLEAILGQLGSPGQPVCRAGLVQRALLVVQLALLVQLDQLASRAHRVNRVSEATQVRLVLPAPCQDPLVTQGQRGPLALLQVQLDPV